MAEIHVKTWEDLQTALFRKKDMWNTTLRRFRSPFAYRGLSDASYKLVTSLMRLGGAYDKLEWHLIRNFRKYAHRDVVSKDTDWHWLTVAQHHGLPTRLLDWTYSPYVALHFATEKSETFSFDGAIWMVNFEEARRYLPSRFKNYLHNNDANGFSIDMLVELDVSPRKLHAYNRSDYLLFFEPPSLDDRIVNQYALFSIMSRPTALLDDWLVAHPKLWNKIVIPAGLKWEVRDKLDQANITERVIFPGLDGLSKWLKRHYSPGP